MSSAQDEIDQRLREYAPRWMAAQPAPRAVDVAQLVSGQRKGRWLPGRGGGRPARWLPVLAVAAAVAVLAGGIGLILGRPSRPPVTTTPSPSSTPGVVPWAPLPSSGASIPATTLPPTPDPTQAVTLPRCRAENLDVSADQEGAGGTRYIFVVITSTSSCRLGGYPSVTALDRRGRSLPVPVEQDVSTGAYTGAVAVGPDAAATLRLGWPSAWCAADITIAKLRLGLPGGGGEVTVDGFGGSACNGVPGSGERAPITVGAFIPQDFTPERVVTAFEGVSAKAIVPESVGTGEQLNFVVVLTAPAGKDVPLDPCPDYTVAIYGGESTTASYTLNCAAVPYRDAAGHPYLPAGTPVRFDMRAQAPAVATPGAKLVWQLDISDTVSAGVGVDLR